MKTVTPKEAVELLESKYHMEGQIDNVLESLAVRHTAVEALKKQISQSPRILSQFYGCPNCGSIRSIRQKHNYCHDCGQALNWED